MGQAFRVGVVRGGVPPGPEYLDYPNSGALALLQSQER